MSKHKSLSYQIKQRLSTLTRYGSSKHQAKRSEGQHPKGIFSFKTFENYSDKCIQFGTWAKENHGARDLEDLIPLADEYLKYRKTVKKRSGQYLSAWTLKLDRAAIEKHFEPEHLKTKEDLPPRQRKDIKKNRGEIKDFNESKHEALVRLGKSTGARREEVSDLRYKDIDPAAGTVLIRQGKGGKQRLIHALDKEILRELTAGEHAPDDKIFDTIPCRYPEHRYRRYYAQSLYNSLARPLRDIPKCERYYCRGDYKGTIYDRKAMLLVSIELGHARTSVIASHYLNKKA
jgi:integrase